MRGVGATVPDWPGRLDLGGGSRVDDATAEKREPESTESCVEVARRSRAQWGVEEESVEFLTDVAHSGIHGSAGKDSGGRTSPRG